MKTSDEEEEEEEKSIFINTSSHYIVDKVEHHEWTFCIIEMPIIILKHTSHMMVITHDGHELLVQNNIQLSCF